LKLRPTILGPLLEWKRYLTSIAFIEWCAGHGIEPRFIQPPASPIRTRSSNGFNKTYRNEMLDAYAFESVEQVREITETCHMTALAASRAHAQGSSPGTLVLNCVLAEEALDRDCSADGNTRRISRL